MEWKLIGSGDVPTGFENVHIDENNLSEHREIMRILTTKAVEDGTIKLCKKTDANQPKNETEQDNDIFSAKKKPEWKREMEEEILQSLGTDVNQEMDPSLGWGSGLSPLMAIAKIGSTESCKMLISAGAEIDKMSQVLDKKLEGVSGCTALMYAALSGELENCKFLISEGADISKETPAEAYYGGCTALHYAAQNWRQEAGEVCKLLVSAGADIDKEDTNGMTPLMHAAEWGNLDVCKLLVLAGADIHKESKKGWTPIIYAVNSEFGKTWDMCKFFIEAGVDAKKCKDESNLILIKLNSDSAMDTMDKFCCNLALLEPDMAKNAILDPNALACAAGQICINICELFILLGADVDKEDKDGWTPLMKAAYNDLDSSSSCNLLLSHGANVDKEVLLDKEPTTALMLAINKGNYFIAEKLLKAGANTDNISKEKLEMLKKKIDRNNSPTTVKEDTISADKDKEETPVYDTCKNIDEAEDLTEACNLKINKSDDNAMTALLEKCKNLISAGANLDGKVDSCGDKVKTPLMNAATHGYTEICKMLIAAGVDVNEKQWRGRTAVTFAAGSGHTEICQILISAGAELPGALYRAMENQQIETCRALISAGSPIPYCDEAGGHTTALIYAANTNMTEICDILITSMGANIDEENEKGQTALMGAAYCGRAESCRFLISKGANIEKEDRDGETALIKASWNVYRHSEFIDVYKELISAGVNVDKQDSNGLTVLMKTDNPEICQLFISAGANINLQDPNGQTALMKTMVWNGQLSNEGVTEKPEICKLLIAAGANMNLQDAIGETALMKASKDGLVDTCKILIAAGADVTMETSGNSELRGYTALHFAVLDSLIEDQAIEIVKMLVSAGANIDHETSEGWTPLMYAAKTDDVSKMRKTLILLGADINKKSKDGWMPLMIAMDAEKEQISFKEDICSMFISLGADVTPETMPNGRTLLSCAASDGFYTICEILLVRGADVNKEDSDGWTPLMKASWSNDKWQFKICEILIAAGANVDKETLMDNKKPTTSLMLDAMKMQFKICENLISAGANVDKEILMDNKKPTTSLMLAAMKGNDKICDVLVSAGANILSTTHYSG